MLDERHAPFVYCVDKLMLDIKVVLGKELQTFPPNLEWEIKALIANALQFQNDSGKREALNEISKYAKDIFPLRSNYD